MLIDFTVKKKPPNFEGESANKKKSIMRKSEMCCAIIIQLTCVTYLYVQQDF